MARPLIVRFPGTDRSTSAETGGKAASLIRMCDAALPVPAGAVLTTAFFAPWHDAVMEFPAWRNLLAAAVDDRARLCDELAELAATLPMTEPQRAALDVLRRDITRQDGDVRVAVRSSSPDEDLSAASFAGLYATRLGVRPDDLEDAVRRCFASSFAVRVLTYRIEHGFHMATPRFAVIVQRQIDSAVAGVAFSLNPSTNDYDEVVIEANWGLGVSVVDGRVSPDHFVVDRVRGEVVAETRGGKQLSVLLAPDGGTVERQNDQSAERTLTDAQLHELSVAVGRIETLYDAPVDIEWAYADDTLHILQARPMTSYVPLPAEMLTRPGQRRRLYADASLSKGLTSNEPISPLGLHNMERMFTTIIESWTGPLKRDVPLQERLFFFAGGRMYMNYSSLLWLASPRRLAKSSAPTDVLMAEILAGIDASEYRAAKRPSWVSVRLFVLVPRMFWSMRGFFRNTLLAIFAPDRVHRACQRKVDDFAAELGENLDSGLPLDEFRSSWEARMARDLFDVVMPMAVVGMFPPALVTRPKTDEARLLTEKLALGTGGDIVVEMGIALHRLAGLLDAAAFDDVDHLADRLERRDLPAAFLIAWDEFIATYGWRGPQEMDVASPRYADDPRLALRQMSFMSVAAEDFDPEAAHQRQVVERQQSYEELMRRSGPVRRMLLRRVYRLGSLFTGTRDTPKHLIVLYNYVLRRRALVEGRRLAGEDRLDAAEHVFDLTFDDLNAAARDPGLDLRPVREERTRFHRKLDDHVKFFPPVIDSRGRILRPPPTDEASGLLRGMPVSRGVVTGRVKVLHTAGEKPVQKGDVLVAYTTDPGWTPLFVNAAAIVLEVGGVLQHGAVVAREYGKPCVVAIDRVMTKLRDGELVEVDGTMGTVRRLS